MKKQCNAEHHLKYDEKNGEEEIKRDEYFKYRWEIAGKDFEILFKFYRRSDRIIDLYQAAEDE